ncbi:MULTISPECIES: GGDEF domain-containing protein [Rhizobium]|uniref:diguanylate cyclase n=1 Tax=Rhizobium miluonense TaxID=411945 RepID=A0A1C3WLN3_9HYPH|nr:GGDEF domain-containing protein [Rhizobium miluonense]SCB40825.1 diguanylate cyclase (GGDEF) domain-containing protein [Rhizobium miluonense]
MKQWISLQAEVGNFQQKRAIYIFALKMSFAAVIMSLAIMIVMLPVLQWLDLLPLPIMEVMRFGVLLAWIIGGTVSGVLAILAGFSIHKLAVSRAEFERLSRTDGLSGLLNRRAFTEALKEAGHGASLVIFDVDRFKTINDRFGHASGDAVIVAVSQILGRVFTGEDMIARLGGEEFGAIIHGGDIDERIARIEAVKEQVANHSIAIDGGSVKITVSAGIADMGKDRKTEGVYAAADKALYLAKTLGRNRVVHERERLSQVWRRYTTEQEEEALPALMELQRYVYRM